MPRLDRNNKAFSGNGQLQDEYVINLTTTLLLLLFLWLFPSSGVAAMVVDRLFPVSPVSCIALSQSYSMHVPLAHILPPCLWSPSLPFPRYRFRHHSSHYVIFFHPHDVPIPVFSPLSFWTPALLWKMANRRQWRSGTDCLSNTG